MKRFLEVLTEQGIEGFGRYYSIYRGIVTNNIDPQNMNRLKVVIPDILGGIVIWALPRNQHGSLKDGFKYLAPVIGDTVYITFEYGDPAKPLWEYHGWSKQQIPEDLNGPKKAGIVTPNGNFILIDDETKELTIHFEGLVNISSAKEVNIVSSDVVSINGSKTGIIINQGKNGPLIVIEKLTEKINNLVNEIDQLKTQLASHTHAGVQSGGSTTAPPTTITQTFTKFNSKDYQDTKCLH